MQKFVFKSLDKLNIQNTFTYAVKNIYLMKWNYLSWRSFILYTS